EVAVWTCHRHRSGEPGAASGHAGLQAEGLRPRLAAVVARPDSEHPARRVDVRYVATAAERRARTVVATDPFLVAILVCVGGGDNGLAPRDAVGRAGDEDFVSATAEADAGDQPDVVRYIEG